MASIKNNTYVSVNRAVAIILMVMGHALCPRDLREMMQLFHMPLFLFFSGYFFKMEQTAMGGVKYIYKKVKGLYWPFVKYSLIFLSLHNVFVRFHILDCSLNVKEIFHNLFLILFRVTNLPSETLLGPLWFIRTLFYACIIIGFCSYLTLLWGNNKKTWWTILIVLLLMSLCFSIFELYVPFFRVSTREFLAAAFCVSGLLFRYYEESLTGFYRWWWAVLGLVLLYWASHSFHASMLDIKAYQILPYFLLALLGIICTDTLCRLVVKHFKQTSKLLAFVGNETLIILVFHLLSFKVLHLLIIKIHGLDIKYLSDFPILKGTESLWYLYTIVGISLPLMIQAVYRRFINGIH